MRFVVDLSAGPPATCGAEEMRITWKSSLRIGGMGEKNLKGFGRHPGRLPADLSQEPVTEDGRRGKRGAKASAGHAGRAALHEDKLGVQGELQDCFLEEIFEKCPYNQEVHKPARRKARRKEPLMQKGYSEPALRSNQQSPPDTVMPHKAARSALRRRGGSEPRQEFHHLPALELHTGLDLPKRAREAVPRQPLMPLTLPPISSSGHSLMAQATCSPSPVKKPKSALRQISAAALSISADLDRAMWQLQKSEERSWAGHALSNVREAEEPEELGSLNAVSGRASSSVDAPSAAVSPASRRSVPSASVSPTNRRSVLSSRDRLQEGSLAVERHPTSRSSMEVAEEPGMNLERLRGAFLNFVEPGTFDLSIEKLTELLRFVGHPVVKSTIAAVQQIVREVTTYEYLDYDEFLSFMEKYAEYEKEHFHDVFNEFDADESGELSMKELRLLLKELGIMALNGMFQEAMSVVDVDCNGQLDFDEFWRFLRIYQRNEGFTAKEVDEISETIDLVRSSVEDQGCKAGIPSDSLSEVLVRFFGTHSREAAKRLQEELTDRHILHNPHAPPTFQLSMREVLLYGRQLRERYYDELKMSQDTSPRKMGGKCSTGKRCLSQLKTDRKNVVEFESYDKNCDHKISIDELRAALHDMQYEPLTLVLQEMLNEVLPEPWEAGRDLEFEEFFDFMLVFRQREGFLKSEVQALKGVFQTFDEQNSGEISGLELGDVFRYLGHAPSIDELKRFVLLVDEDRSNELNFREFLRLMQLHRNSVIRRMRDVFGIFREPQTRQLPRANLLAALARYGQKDPPKEVILKVPNEPMDFESFVCLVDELHRCKVAQERRRAGFSITEIDNILEMFRRFDKDFGWAPKTLEEQDEIWGRLDRARSLAREAGVENTTEDGSASVREWEFVQLARMIRRQQETADERAEARLAHHLKFSMSEVNEFREIFNYWLKEHEESDNSEEEDGTQKEEKDKAITRDTVRRIVRRMGVKFTTESKALLDKELVHLCGGDSIMLDFHGFLHLMRWIVDTGFGGICAQDKPTLR